MTHEVFTTLYVTQLATHLRRAFSAEIRAEKRLFQQEPNAAVTVYPGIDDNAIYSRKEVMPIMSRKFTRGDMSFVEFSNRVIGTYCREYHSRKGSSEQDKKTLYAPGERKFFAVPQPDLCAAMVLPVADLPEIISIIAGFNSGNLVDFDQRQVLKT